MYMKSTKPTMMLAVAKKGDTSGLKRNDDTAVQSRVNAPRPKPFMPDPSCCAVTDLEKIQQTHDMDVSVGKRYPGTAYHRKLHASATRKNLARDADVRRPPPAAGPPPSRAAPGTETPARACRATTCAPAR
jgi:hypothetical protein